MKSGLPCCMVVAWLLVALPARPGDPAAMKISAPKPSQVVQRAGNEPGAAKRAPGGAGLGYADVAVQADFASDARRRTWEYRVVPLPEVRGREAGWTLLE